MRFIMLVALATSTLFTGTVAEAQNRPGGPDHSRDLRDGRPDIYGGRQHDRFRAQRRWQRGERFDERYATNYREIDYKRYRGLRAPPRGYRYVRSGNDAVLVAVATGIVAAVIANAVR